MHGGVRGGRAAQHREKGKRHQKDEKKPGGESPGMKKITIKIASGISALEKNTKGDEIFHAALFSPSVFLK